ncbi:Lsm (Like Sm) protein involved in RNA processing [Komagataella phaffii CBS 7435]|uniref:LSM complex subunit LSM3 n=2 Tax=Komagataella phaffii TaxID=460519 RepID=C4QVU4_KOMPG|nr:Lsm (Like Sm) protein [Komagataella phaffii GS115]KAI0465223.1 hypothetical protein LJB42_000448 [Komagataella kurtzmanii]CAH2446026.1 Lsm (Like Sm) protein involved in RNA processing [Komagataella phaffii CBS 7435]CAY67367.1 Lsm (Like Sm) protein [Komagataella phaffii GS115]SCV11787.1 Lsm (Like Sm) protein involved in RNA processing [Komagataella phaffii CBS 7435]
MSVSEPLNMIKLCLDEKVYVKLRGAREIVGKLHAYDNHCNLVLGDAVETISTVDENNELKTQTKDRPMVYLRGDSVILVANASQ